MDYPHLAIAKSIDDLEHACDKYTELRERVKEGGSTAYAYQCQFCGLFKSGEVSKKSTNRPPMYDSELEAEYQRVRSDFIQQSTNQLRLERPITIPIVTDHYSGVEDLINEYCEQNNLSKNSIIQTLLIRQRFRYIENEFNSIWENESQLQDWFVDNFSEHFEIHREVTGYGYIDREISNVRIDFILKAKPKLIDHGFTDQYIGVEAKYFSPKDGKNFHGKSSRGVFQALSYWYSGARWFLSDTEEIELATVLIFSNLSFQKEAESLFNTMDSYFKNVWKSYLSVANHANVGELQVRTANDRLSYWKMEYDGTKYYSMSAGEYSKGNPNVINKKRIGNFKR